MRNIYLGDRGVLVQYLQLALTRAGYPVELDGIFGTDTCKALQEFRREYAMHGETVGCYVDQSVWKQLIPYLKGYVTHVIVKGDTIWNIAGAYGTTQEAVLRANPSIQVNALQPGMRIYVPLAFPLVSEEVAYTSILLAFYYRRAAYQVSVSDDWKYRNKCYGKGNSLYQNWNRCYRGVL